MTQLDSTSFTWSIENFANLDTLLNYSSDFETNQAKFGLGCIAVKVDKDLNCRISICLFRSEPYTTDLKVLWTISLINDKGEECHHKAYEMNFTFDRLPTEGLVYYNVDRNTILNPASGLLPGGKLIIKSTVTILDGESNRITFAHKKVRKNYQTLLENSKFSDVVFVIGKKEFKLHKTILASQSPVFSAMFENDLEEAKQNRVTITDIDVEVFEAMIRFIYTANVDSVGQYALDLFVAADKYQMDHLKSICEQSLISSLTTESVCGVFLLSDMHNAEQLKEKCTEFMVENAKEVLKTEGWKELVNSKRIDLVADLFEKLAYKDD